MALDSRIVRESYKKLRTHGEDIVDYFYKTLMSQHPETKVLFSVFDISSKKEDALTSLDFVIENLDRRDSLAEFLRDSGRRNLKVSVNDHVNAIRDAASKTLKHFLDEEYDTRIEDQWIATFNRVIEGLLLGAPKGKTIAQVFNPNMAPDTSISNLREYARTSAQRILREMINEEMQTGFPEKVRANVQKMLIDALEKETATALGEVSEPYPISEPHLEKDSA